ncbi:MAG: triose-phosphate isomerase [Elusimicrobiota bacterium]
MRKPYIAGNWKMNKTNKEAVQMVQEFKNLVSDVEEVDMMIAPPYTALPVLNEVLKDSNIMLGAQNMHQETSGAYTGEISPDMLKDTGCGWVILGHSERREYFGCTDELVNKKLKVAMDKDLKPIICLGEKLEQREAGKAFDVIKGQLDIALKDITAEHASSLTIAYEPVWAIGTGKTATPEQANEVHEFIRENLSEKFGPEIGSGIRILYGGSVKPYNVKELMQEENIDGGLIGGASLEAESFSKIVKFKNQ